MKKGVLITGLDIGSSKISAITVEISREGSLSVVGQVTQPSRGIDRGTIVDLNETVRCVSGVMSKLKSKISGSPGDIYANISGQNIKGSISKGMIPLSLRGREVTLRDIERCIEAAGTIYIPFDREIIHNVVQEFSVDDEPPIKNPIGLYASRLSCEAYVITAPASHIQNINKSVNNAGYDIKEVVFTGIADGSILLDRDIKAPGALIADIGSSLTEICSFVDGSCSDLEILPVGGQDLKSGFMDCDGLKDAIGRIRAKLDNLSEAGRKPDSIILTGGASLGDGLAEYLEEKLSYPVKMGIVKDVRGDISSMDSVRLSTAVGLAKYASEKRNKKFRERGALVSRLSTAVVDIFNNYF